jgi:sec-independent protein translocase protein TatC
MFWIGVAFEFPLVIFALSAIGILEPKVLLQQWRLAVILIAVVAAIITPTVDPVNMGLVMAPMIGLYFLSILFSAIARATNRPK